MPAVLDRVPWDGGGTDSEERLLAWKLNHTPRGPETGTAFLFQGKKQPGYYSSQRWIDAATVYLFHICLWAEHMSLSEPQITLSLSASGSANELSKRIWLSGQLTHKWTFCHHILNLMLFQTCTLRDLETPPKWNYLNSIHLIHSFSNVLKSHNRPQYSSKILPSAPAFKIDFTFSIFDIVHQSHGATH